MLHTIRFACQVIDKLLLFHCSDTRINYSWQLMSQKSKNLENYCQARDFKNQTCKYFDVNLNLSFRIN